MNKFIHKPLTSVRFIFAFLVFLSHLSFISSEEVHPLVKHYFEEGYIGVSFFFILSGFILNMNYNDITLDKISLKKFYIRRATRIYPMHILTFLISIPIYIYIIGGKLEDLNPLIVSSQLFLFQSLIPLKEFYYSFNNVSWSISNEIFYYLLFPFIAFYFRKYSKKVLVVLLILYSVIYLLVITSVKVNFIQSIIYISPFIRIYEFIIGMILFLFYSHYSIKLRQYGTTILTIGICLIISQIFLDYEIGIPLRFKYSLYYFLPITMIILGIALNQTSVFNRILQTSAFYRLGEISFSFYMWHHLVLRYLRGGLIYMNIEINHFLLAIFGFIISLSLSIISFNLIETRLRIFLNSKISRR